MGHRTDELLTTCRKAVALGVGVKAARDPTKRFGETTPHHLHRSNAVQRHKAHQNNVLKECRAARTTGRELLKAPILWSDISLVSHHKVLTLIGLPLRIAQRAHGCTGSLLRGTAGPTTTAPFPGSEALLVTPVF